MTFSRLVYKEIAPLGPRQLAGALVFVGRRSPNRSCTAGHVGVPRPRPPRPSPPPRPTPGPTNVRS